MTAHPSAVDLPYLRATFVELGALCRAHGHDAADVRRAIEDRMLPAAPYVLADGTELVAPDFFELAHTAGGFAELRGWFHRTWEQASARYPEAGTAEEQWEEYLSGMYAVCLRSVTPAGIVAKAELVDTIERLTSEPLPDDEGWRRELSTAVDALDALEKPFAQFDRERFGRSSRDRLIADVRERFELEAPAMATA